MIYMGGTQVRDASFRASQSIVYEEQHRSAGLSIEWLINSVSVTGRVLTF